MLDPRLAKVYKTAETLQRLASYWSTHVPPRMTKEAQGGTLPLQLAQYTPAVMGMGPIAPYGKGMINQWLAKLLGEGALSQFGRSLIEQHWSKPVRPSLSFPAVSPKNNITSSAYLDRLNQLRAETGQSILPIGSSAGG